MYQPEALRVPLCLATEYLSNNLIIRLHRVAQITLKWLPSRRDIYVHYPFLSKQWRN